MAYLAYDQPTADWPLSITLPEGAFTDVSRDVFGKPLSITRRDAAGMVALTRYYIYDAYQQLCKTIEPEAGATVVDYDGVGNPIWSATGLALPVLPTATGWRLRTPVAGCSAPSMRAAESPVCHFPT